MKRFTIVTIIAGCAAPTARPPSVAPRAPTAATATPTPTVPPAAEHEGEACGAFSDRPDDSVMQYVSARDATWEPGTTLKVSFLDGRDEWKQVVESHAKQWAQFANIKFEFGVDPSVANLRISFQAPGYWSLVGSSAAFRSKDLPTMNFHFNLFTAEPARIQRVILHEFGHSLGLHHEHRNPNLKVTWDREYIYAYYAKQSGWTRQQVDTNVLNPASTEDVEAGDFDERSIMLYPFPPEFTKERYSSPNNTELSVMDKAHIAKLYPGRVDPHPVTPQPAKPDMTGLTKQLKTEYQVTSAIAGTKRKNYAATITGPAAVIAQLDHVLYQRQGDEFPEFKRGTYYRSSGPDENFSFEWHAETTTPILVRMVWKNGIVVRRTHTQLSRDNQPKVDWDALRAKVKFTYLVANPAADKWAKYSIKMTLKDKAGEFITHVEYQRQHETFPEMKDQRFIPIASSNTGFTLAWKGYAWVPVIARVHFKDGTTKEYPIAGPPESAK